MIKTFTFSLKKINNQLQPFRFHLGKFYHLSRIAPKSELMDSLMLACSEKGYKYTLVKNELSNDLSDIYNYYHPEKQINKVEHTINKWEKIKQYFVSSPEKKTDAIASFLTFLQIEYSGTDIFIYADSTSELLHVLLFSDQQTIVANEVFDTINLYDEYDANYAMATYFPESDDDYNLNLDEETKKIVSEIEAKLIELNETGNFLSALPLLEKHINRIKEQTIISLSPVQIDEHFRIFLPDYNNQEIKLNHLTKSLYFLFLMEREIKLEDLFLYREKLFHIYKNVSYQENMTKMLESIDKLIKNEQNEIYIHFSRIKSTFCKVMDESVAKNYYIVGGKGQPKRIDLDMSLYTIFLSGYRLIGK